MSTAVAPATVPQVPLAPPPSEPGSSPKTSFHARSSPNQAERSIASATARTNSPNAPIVLSEGAAKPKITPDSKRSPLSYVQSSDILPSLSKMLLLHDQPSHSAYQLYSARHGPPKIVVKKEPPSSPEVPAISRHRPRKLDLVSSNSQSQTAAPARPSAPLTSRESGALAMHEVGLACLSPGFQTQDPSMREQLQRSYSVRDQQRHIIESRMQKTAKPTDPDGRSMAEGAFGGGGMKTPSMTKKRPPNGLSIVPPSHEQFANERVIQSAPLNQSFTGRQQAHPLTRHIANQSSNLSHTSHIHHTPAAQTNNRLPPISDVFAADGLGMQRREGQYHSNSNSSHSNHRPAFPSPGHPPPSSHPPPTSRARDFRSAEEAVAEMAQGREELLPKIVHYSSNHPPTPPSPPTHGGATSSKHVYGQMNGEPLRSSRRRPRSEYEREIGTPPLGSGPEPRERRGPFGLGIDSPETQGKKKDEFLGLCARAWDLFHS